MRSVNRFKTFNKLVKICCGNEYMWAQTRCISETALAKVYTLILPAIRARGIQLFITLQLCIQRSNNHSTMQSTAVYSSIHTAVHSCVHSSAYTGCHSCRSTVPVGSTRVPYVLQYQVQPLRLPGFCTGLTGNLHWNHMRSDLKNKKALNRWPRARVVQL